MYFSNISTASPSSNITLVQSNLSKLILVVDIASSSLSIEYTTPLLEILEACTVIVPVPEPTSNTVEFSFKFIFQILNARISSFVIGQLPLMNSSSLIKIIYFS